jgi:GNAT superfamily N-acetyltransferase
MTTPRIVPLRPAEAGDDVLGRVWELERLLAARGEPLHSRADAIRSLRAGVSAARRWYWLVGVEGYASLLVQDGSSTGFLTELVVAPAARRQGIGRALVSAAADQARAVGCAYLVGGYLDEAVSGFLQAVGARNTTDRVRRSVLRLPLTTPPVPAVDGYRVVSWTGAAPEELLASYAEARNAINDAPRDESIDDERYTPERIRAMESVVKERDTELRVTVAVDAAGRVGGFTDIRVPNEAGASAFTDDTAVLAAHRRRGLAMWIKDACLRRLAEERPDVRAVVTDNDVTNGPMLAVNDRLGFVATAVRTGAVLDL